MNIQWMYWLGSILLTFLAFYFGRKDRTDSKNKQEVQQDTTIALNIDYIKKSVDNMTLEQKDINRKLEKQGEENLKMKDKLTKENTEIKVGQAKILSSLSSLHKRVDRVEICIDTCKKEVTHD